MLNRPFVGINFAAHELSPAPEWQPQPGERVRIGTSDGPVLAVVRLVHQPSQQVYVQPEGVLGQRPRWVKRERVEAA